MLLGRPRRCARYEKISVPVSSPDRRTRSSIPGAFGPPAGCIRTLQRVPACGHMVHHAASEDVVAAIAALARLQGIKAVARAMASTAPRRNWLHIGEGLVAA